MRAYLIAIVSCLLCGCSALHWGGEAAGRSPGLRIDLPGPFGGGGVSATADTNAEAKLIKCSDKDGRLFEAHEISFGQNAAAVVREEPAKIDAVARLQLTQVEYARTTWEGVRGLAAELLPVLKLLALAQFTQTESGFTATLPGGLSLGRQTLSKPADLQEFFQEALHAVECVAAEEDTPVPRPASEMPAAGP